MIMFMTPSENPTEMGQDETLHLFDKGFPSHDIRKQALFKLVTEQMDKARKVLDFHNLPAAFRPRSGLNAATTFDKVQLEPPSPDQRHGRGDEETSPNGMTPCLDTADHDNRDGEATLAASEVPQPTPENPPNPDQSDEYILSLVMALDYIREVELGLCPISVNLDLGENKLMGMGSGGTSGKPNKVGNRRMRWTISQNDPGEPANENSPSPASSEDESLDELEVSLISGGGDSAYAPCNPPFYLIFCFILLFTLSEVIGQYPEYSGTIAPRPLALWDRLVNLSLLQGKKIWTAFGWDWNMNKVYE